MYGNGAVTGMARIHLVHKRILPDHLPALPACCVVVAGPTVRGAAGCLFASTSIRRTASMAVSAWFLCPSLKFAKTRRAKIKLCANRKFSKNKRKTLCN